MSEFTLGVITGIGFILLSFLAAIAFGSMVLQDREQNDER